MRTARLAMSGPGCGALRRTTVTVLTGGVSTLDVNEEGRRIRIRQRCRILCVCDFLPPPSPLASPPLGPEGHGRQGRRAKARRSTRRAYTHPRDDVRRASTQTLHSRGHAALSRAAAAADSPLPLPPGAQQLGVKARATLAPRTRRQRPPPTAPSPPLPRGVRAARHWSPRRCARPA
ncbi:hypothetical protein BC628DRAFT_1404673 [Trametes gibbosa]|nr:hypothetical protein BC628DRAFT_1404673 [Trametes gibbosa]